MPDPILLAALQRTAGFKHLDTDATDALATAMKRADFMAGAKVFRQNAPGQRMFFVASGLLRVEFEARNGLGAPGGSTVIGNVRPGEFVGEMALVDPAPRSATVVAASDAVLFGLDRAAFAELQLLAPAASSAIVSVVLRDLSRRLTRLDKTLAKTLGQPDMKAAPWHGDADASGSDEDALLKRLWLRVTGRKGAP